MKTTKKRVRGGENGGNQGARKGIRRREDKAALVAQVIQNIEERLRREEIKATVGDLIRLVQLEKELEEERPKEIKVTWIEPKEGGCCEE